MVKKIDEMADKTAELITIICQQIECPFSHCYLNNLHLNIAHTLMHKLVSLSLQFTLIVNLSLFFNTLRNPGWIIILYNKG